MDRANCRVAQDNKFSPAYPNSKTLKGDIYIYNVYLLELYIYIYNFSRPKACSCPALDRACITSWGRRNGTSTPTGFSSEGTCSQQINCMNKTAEHLYNFEIGQQKRPTWTPHINTDMLKPEWETLRNILTLYVVSFKPNSECSHLCKSRSWLEQ